MTYLEMLDRQNDKLTKYAQAFGFIKGYMSSSSKEWTPEYREKVSKWMDEMIWPQIWDDNLKSLDFDSLVKSVIE